MFQGELRLKHLARTTTMSPHEIITDVLNGMHRDAVATMTAEHLLKKKIQYARNRAGIQRPNRPTTKNGWTVPQDLETFVEDGGRFLQVRHHFTQFDTIYPHFQSILPLI